MFTNKMLTRVSALLASLVVLFSCSGKVSEPLVLCTGEDYPEGSWYAFRKAFDIKGDPSAATLDIEADTKYWLWINGEQIVREGNLKRGPTPQDGYYDHYPSDIIQKNII